MIKYVGVKAEAEVKRVVDEFILKTQEENKKIKYRRNITLLLVFVVTVIIAGIFAFLIYPEDKQDVLSTSTYLLFGVELAVFVTYYDELNSAEEWAWPIAYQCWKKTNGFTILKSEMHYNERTHKKDLWLTLKNSENEVSHDCIRNFKSVTRTDIKHTIVDLDQGVVYEPYKEFAWFAT